MPGDGAHRRGARGGRGADARAGARVGRARRSPSSRPRSGASTPSRCASTPRSSGAAPRARCRCSAWATMHEYALARRAARVAARPRAQRLGRHARRRARQLVRPVAAADAGRRRRARSRPRSGAPASARVTLRYASSACGRSVVAAQKPSKLLGRVRFPSPALDSHGEWRSLVAHPAGGRAVAGSNPVSPTTQKTCNRGPFVSDEPIVPCPPWNNYGTNSSVSASRFPHAGS